MLTSHTIIDGFLGEQLSRDLLEFAVSHEAGFVPTTVYSTQEGAGLRRESRTSFRFDGDWKGQRKAFRAVIEERIEEIVSGAGTPGFRPDKMEMEMVATRNGGHFIRHIDTLTQITNQHSDRVVSAVYYMHREPVGFTGGELVMHALIGDETKLIEPRHDRLAVFTSIAPHEVAPTHVPGNAFADARFSINCWLHRLTK